MRAVSTSPPAAVNAPMIVYDLACAHGHRFEGWFGSGEEFARPAGARPRALPGVRRRRRSSGCLLRVLRCPRPRRLRRARRTGRSPTTPAPTTRSPGIPPELIAKLREVVRNTENVGTRFPEEARKIHYEEVPARAIRGQASAEEAQALRDEGIDFAPIPPFLTREPH